MLDDVKFQQLSKANAVPKEISFTEFIKLYVNHRPARGMTMDDLKESFRVINNGEDVIDLESLQEVLCEEGKGWAVHFTNYRVCSKTYETGFLKTSSDIQSILSSE